MVLRASLLEGLEQLVGAWKQVSARSVMSNELKRHKIITLTSDGPPFRSSLPCVMGLTTPGLRLAAGLDRLPAGSPDPTCI